MRFDAYFLEDVLQSRLETQRVRRCVLLYYLADATLQARRLVASPPIRVRSLSPQRDARPARDVQIEEPRVENSGIAGGTFVKRQARARERSRSLRRTNPAPRLFFP